MSLNEATRRRGRGRPHKRTIDSSRLDLNIEDLNSLGEQFDFKIKSAGTTYYWMDYL